MFLGGDFLPEAVAHHRDIHHPVVEREQHAFRGVEVMARLRLQDDLLLLQRREARIASSSFGEGMAHGVLGAMSCTVFRVLPAFTTKTPRIRSCSTAIVTKSAF